jgi:hypothetical protein
MQSAVEQADESNIPGSHGCRQDGRVVRVIELFEFLDVRNLEAVQRVWLVAGFPSWGPPDFLSWVPP